MNLRLNRRSKQGGTLNLPKIIGTGVNLTLVWWWWNDWLILSVEYYETFLLEWAKTIRDQAGAILIFVDVIKNPDDRNLALDFSFDPVVTGQCKIWSIFQIYQHLNKIM